MPCAPPGPAAKPMPTESAHHRTRAPETAGPAAAAAAGPGGGHEASFTWPVRVFYEDTDAGGVVYYANYLRFFERCRSEWFRSLGFALSELAKRDGVLFMVAGAQIEYLRPARLDDLLHVDARIAQRAASYVVFEQQARRGTTVLSRASVKVACVDANSLRPRRLPHAVAQALAASEPAER